jgi:hypothetical protein
LDGATAAIASVQGLSDENATRQRLASAKEFLDRAAAIKPGDSRLQPAQARYDENMDRVNRVTPLYGTVPLWTFNGDGQNLTSAIVKGNHVYVLDRGRQQIDHFVLGRSGDSMTPASPPVALAKRDQVKGSDQVVADLVDMGWVDAVSNQTSHLLTLDGNNALYAYDANFGASPLAVAGRNQWGGPQLISGYNGNLYVVDPKANQIWRYKPSEKGYENPPESYFAPGNQVDLAGIQSIAIDGNIWLLYADGRLLKFFGGEQKPFELQGLPSPLSNPAAIAAAAEGDQLYIADTGNGRIIELNKQGQFQRRGNCNARGGNRGAGNAGSNAYNPEVAKLRDCFAVCFSGLAKLRHRIIIGHYEVQASSLVEAKAGHLGRLIAGLSAHGVRDRFPLRWARLFGPG